MTASKENGSVKSIFYVYAKVGEKKFPGQIEITGTGGEDGSYAANVSEFFNDVAAEPVEGQIVTIEPREVTAAFKGGSKAAPAAAAAAPAGPRPDASGMVCPIHQIPFTVKQGRFGYFESCSEKNPDNSYCNQKPPK